MVAKGHSHATKLACVFLARQSSADAAAEAFRVDRNTVRRWVENVEVPDDAWTAIRDVLQARAAEMAAKGETRGLVQTLTGAGIAERNVRYGQLIARREARKAEEDTPEPPSPIRVQIDRLDMRRQRLLREELQNELNRRAIGLSPEPEPDGATGPEDASAVTALVDELLARSDAEVDARYQALEGERREIDRIQREMDEEERRSKLRGFEHAVNVTPEQRRMIEEAQLLLETS